MEYNVDATNAIAGRLAARVAKEALSGKTVHIVNAEKAVMSGNARVTAARYFEKLREIGQPHKGPFIPRMPDRFLKRLIRGMLPKQGRGIDAYKRIKCHIGIPEELEGKTIEPFPGKHVKDLPTLKYTTIKDICRHLGGKQ